MSVKVCPVSRLANWLKPFSTLFTRPTWRRVLTLVTGTILATQRRTVSAALRATGYDQASDFARYHAVLNRDRWSALAVAQVSLRLLIAAFVPTGPVVIGLDDTIERRWGAKIGSDAILMKLAG